MLATIYVRKRKKKYASEHQNQKHFGFFLAFIHFLLVRFKGADGIRIVNPKKILFIDEIEKVEHRNYNGFSVDMSVRIQSTDEFNAKNKIVLTR